MAIIESAGTITLETVGSWYLLHDDTFSALANLRFAGSLVTIGQFGDWTPVGAERTASGYQVVWKNGTANQYKVWTTDSSGNWLSESAVLSGASAGLQALEPTFGQDFNGDGTIGPPPTAIETAGSTTLMPVGSTYYLYASGTTSGPQLKYGGVAVTIGQFGAWTPIGAEPSGSGYQVVWKNGTADQYKVWTVDNNGNRVSESAVLSGASFALQSLETTFGQDLNNDATIGRVTVAIESSAATTLSKVADTYFLYANGTTSGPQLKYGGAVVKTGQFGSWTPLGAEQTDGIYKVVWKNALNEYVIWNVDGSGNWLSQSALLGGASVALRSLEPGFGQDLNGDASIASLTVIDSFGSTTLGNVANTYVLSPSGSALGPQLKYGGALVMAGQFGSWTPIGAEHNGGGYQVVWKFGTSDQYIVWNVDGSGNWLSQSAGLSGASTTIQLLEVGFDQDLNGSGGITSRNVIESFGSTTLASFANTYGLSANGSTSGPQLKYAGALVAAGQFGSWTPVGAEQNGGGYQVVWKNSLNQYIVWNVDGNGNWLSQSAVLSGASSTMQLLEVGFDQDLNASGAITSKVVIESSGSTTLASIANTYVLSPNGGMLDTPLKYGGTLVVAGQFGAWTPLTAELSAGMYRLVWKNGTADQYIAWNVDTSGNHVSQGPVVSGSSWWAQSYEPIVQSDFNGDGTLGPIVAPIETSGASSLTQVADAFFINYGSSHVQVRYGNGYAADGQFGAWTPIAAEQTLGGSIVAWKNGAADQYLVWNLDSAGNYLWQSAVVSGGSSVLQALELSLQQDLNQSGGVFLSTPMIESSGSIRLAQVGNNYLLDPAGGLSGPLLSYGGSYVTVGQFGSWTPIGAEWTGNGYQVAWKMNAVDRYMVWTTDSSGRYLSQTGTMFGSSSALESFENSFQQDINADGVRGVPPPAFDITVSFSGDSSYLPYFQQAAARWEQVIIGDLADYAGVDDILISASVQYIDGVGRILGQAGVTDVRPWFSPDADMPYRGLMQFDSADLAGMASDGTLYYVILHEMGHALGLGTMWSYLGLRSGFNYYGQGALNAYRLLTGNDSLGSVPLETTGGSGTAGVHWSDSVFNSELMTGYISGAPAPLSTVTIGSLQDIGYRVNYSAADSYFLGQLTADAQVAAALSAAALVDRHDSFDAAFEMPAAGQDIATGDVWLDNSLHLPFA